MNQCIVLLLVGLFGAISCASIDSESAADFDLVVVEDIDEYLKENPEVKLLQKLERFENRVQIRYTLGSRVSGALVKRHLR